MLRRLVSIALFAAAAASAAASAAADQPAATSDRQAIAFASARGRLLFGLDRAAWVATDDLAERVPDWQNIGLAGYIVERSGDGFAVTFYGGPEAARVAFYRAEVRNNRVRSRQVFAASARPPLTPEQRRLAAARATAGASTRHRACNGRPFNTAVVPPDRLGGPIDVYLMTPQVRAGEFPVGGHFRVTVGPDGRVIGERAFTNSCLTVGADPSGNAVALVVTHLLDPVPTEIHVFTSLTAGMPLMVGIAEPERLFLVTGDRIREVPPPAR